MTVAKRFAEVHDDFMQKRQSGGVVTMVTAVILAVLLYCEVYEFFSVEILHSITASSFGLSLL